MDNIAEFERRILVALDKIERHMTSDASASSGVGQSEEMVALTLRNQKMTVIARTSDTDFQKLVLGDFRFVPLLGDKN